ncbi:MAG: DUF4911 domain-containing protein [Desulfovibrionaceae bacterium]|nr:DUF4911 domain-containing protein [Desulfovibrionaceae bacterium]
MTQDRMTQVPTAPPTPKKRTFRPRKPGPALPPPHFSRSLLIRLAPEQTGMFRFLLEAYDNLAYFTVLEKDTALLRLLFSPHDGQNVRRALDDMARSIPFRVEEWPFGEDDREEAPRPCAD